MLWYTTYICTYLDKKKCKLRYHLLSSKCINPNHYHHHHHHHEPPTIKLTHNPIPDDPEADNSGNAPPSPLAALLFHPPQYHCVICQHNASLYRALSNPSIFSSRLPHSSGPHMGSANLHTTSSSSKPFANMTSSLNRNKPHRSSILNDKDAQDATDCEDDEVRHSNHFFLLHKQHNKIVYQFTNTVFFLLEGSSPKLVWW